MANSNGSTTGAPEDGTLSTQTELPISHAFVVQLRGSSTGAGELAGRVEHISSGRRRRFDSLPELAAFMSNTIARSEASR